jgi:hypothetical protein
MQILKYLWFVLLGAFAKLRKATINFVMFVLPSVRMEVCSHCRILIKFDIWYFFLKIGWGNSSLIKIRQKIMGTLYEDVFTCMTISRWIFLRMRNVSNKSCTHFVFILAENRTVYEIMSKNVVMPEKARKIWCLRVACWISKQAHAHARACTTTPPPQHTECSKYGNINIVVRI